MPVTWVNSADDPINPPGPGIAEREAAKMPGARFVLIPETPKNPRPLHPHMGRLLEEGSRSPYRARGFLTPRRTTNPAASSPSTMATPARWLWKAAVPNATSIGPAQAVAVPESA